MLYTTFHKSGKQQKPNELQMQTPFYTCMQTRMLHFNSHFPGEPGLANFIEAKYDGSGGDNWTVK